MPSCLCNRLNRTCELRRSSQHVGKQFEKSFSFSSYSDEDNDGDAASDTGDHDHTESRQRHRDSYQLVHHSKRLAWIDWLSLTFNFPLDTIQVISEILFPANLLVSTEKDWLEIASQKRPYFVLQNLQNLNSVNQPANQLVQRDYDDVRQLTWPFSILRLSNARPGSVHCYRHHRRGRLSSQLVRTVGNATQQELACQQHQRVHQPSDHPRPHVLSVSLPQPCTENGELRRAESIPGPVRVLVLWCACYNNGSWQCFGLRSDDRHPRALC